MSTTRRTRFGRWLAGAAGLVALVTLAVPAAAQSDVATLSIGDVEGVAGDEVEIPVELAGASQIGALHLEITYDPEVLSALGVDTGSLAPADTLVDFNATDGRLVIGAVTSDAISGDGPIIVTRFEVVGEEGDTSALGLENVQAWEATTERFELKTDIAEGSFTVASAGSSWLLPALIAAAALLLVLLLVVLARRRRRRPEQAAPPPPPPPPPPPSAAVPGAGPPPGPSGSAASVWRPTHRVPATGAATYPSPDPGSTPGARLDPGLEVRVDEHQGAWARVTCSNGWSAWVDAGVLERLA